ncbi:hypothetical protein Pfo_001434 [Paulownia fortunei]|nr:hypothetical protein Pfo_001434 [Paulownia fortunei]
MEAHSRVEKAPKYYLHTTRSLPFLCAEHIAMICLYSLWKFVSKIPFSPSNFVNSFQHFLRKLENLQKTSCRHWTGNSAIYEKYSMPSCKVDAVCKIEVICGHGKKGKDVLD